MVAEKCNLSEGEKKMLTFFSKANLNGCYSIIHTHKGRIFMNLFFLNLNYYVIFSLECISLSCMSSFSKNSNKSSLCPYYVDYPMVMYVWLRLAWFPPVIDRDRRPSIFQALPRISSSS